ncbi:SRPBCC family protein [Paraconexibacter sp.]|uniref:SRPBCC family protein n=1 Tax=Paraconexibacter sp. TaxID=2949640 RepID=UPI003569A933
MRVAATIDIAATPAEVWGFITDPERSLHFLHGVTRFERAGDHAPGPGMRFRMLMRIGSAEIGSLVEVVEWHEHRDLAWTSVTGLDQRARWRLRERDSGRTHVEFRLSYGVAGAGLGGWIAERVAAPQVRRNFQRSLVQLKRQVEHERLRTDAARRRAARSTASSG